MNCSIHAQQIQMASMTTTQKTR